MPTFHSTNPMYLLTCLDFLERVTHHRVQAYLGNEPKISDVQLTPPKKSDRSAFANFIRSASFSTSDVLMICAALVPHVAPGFFDRVIAEYLPQGGEFSEFGGVKGAAHRGTLPTGETALFLLAGTAPEDRLSCLSIFSEESFLFQNKIISLGAVKAGEPKLSGRLLLDPELVEVILTGKVARPKMSTEFPAEHLITKMDWDDLVLDERTAAQIKDLKIWVEHGDQLMDDWGMGDRLKSGYRALFYGPPGTGKTLTATLLGKSTQRDVFRIDLSKVVSKYIGETEKNLANLFDKAEHKQWILFFDEADSLFGKRTGVRDAHDRYANQEVSYLLQRIESFPGLIILATNFKNNIDAAFVRRFNAIVYFPAPNAKQRLLLWEKAFPEQVKFDKSVDLEALAEKFELTGSQIINIVQYCCLQLLYNKDETLTEDVILMGIKKELAKEGK